MRKGNFRKVFAMALAMLMLLSLLPASVYAEGEATIVASFDALEEAVLWQGYEEGEIEGEGGLQLPDTLSGRDEGGEPLSIPGVSWACTLGGDGESPAFDPAVPGSYAFSATLPQGYALGEGAELPRIGVIIRPEGGWGIAPTSFTGGAMVLTGISAGGLQAAVEGELGGSSPSMVTSLKLSGATLNDADFTFIKNNLSGLQTLDLSGLTELTALPDNALNNGLSGANGGLNNLATVVLPTTMQTIGTYALRGCIALTQVDLSNVTALGNGAFAGCTSLTFKAGTNLNTNLTTIPSSAFRDCASLTGVDLSNVTTLDLEAFNGCTLLTLKNGTNLNTNLTAIPISAFRDCASLTGVDLSNVTALRNYAFYGCTSLGDVNLSNVTSIGNSAFAGCTNLTLKSGTNLNPGLTTIHLYAFYGCTSLTGIDLSNVLLLNEFAFEGCTSLTLKEGTNLNAGLTTISDSAFYGCTSLTGVDLSKVTTIYAHAFDGCTNLTLKNGTDLNPGLARVRYAAFHGCTSLTDLDLSNVSAVEGSAFEGCTALTGVDLSSATVVGTDAFKNCTNLKAAALPAAKPTMGTDAFGGSTPALMLLVDGGGSYENLDEFPSGSSYAAIDGSASLNAGDTLSLSVTPNAGNAVSYQWKKGSNNLPGETNQSYTKSNTTTADSGTYSCAITLGSVTVTKTASVTVSPVNASINLSSFTFDKYSGNANYKDLVVTLAQGSYTLSAIKIDGTSLVSGTDYTVGGGVYTIKKERLAQLTNGSHTVTFDMTGGTDPSLALTVADSTPIDASINLSSFTFDKYSGNANYKDLVVTLAQGSYSLSQIRIGSTSLTPNTDYTVSSGVYTIKKERLAQLTNGSHTVTFDMTGGTDPSLALTVADSTPVLTADSAELSFGGMALHAASKGETITVSGIFLDGTIAYTLEGEHKDDFTITQTSWSPDAGGTLTIVFTPSAKGMRNATLTFGTNGAQSITVALSGTGLLPIPGVPGTPGGIPGVPGYDYTYQTLRHEKTGVTLSGWLAKGAQLVVTENVLHAAGSCAACDEIRAAGNLVVLYDVSLTGGHKGDVELSLPVPSAYNGRRMTVLHCRRGYVEKTVLTASNGYVTGRFSDLSPFAVFAGESGGNGGSYVPMPQTGDDESPMLWLLLMALALLGCGIVGRRHGKNAR